jgi:hypothetical protein
MLPAIVARPFFDPSLPPPQLDEFVLRHDAPLRVDDLRALGCRSAEFDALAPVFPRAYVVIITIPGECDAVRIGA